MTPARCRQRRRSVSCGDRIPPVHAATVLKWQLSVLLAFGLLAGVATASSSTLSGTYKATITGKPAALNGRWRLEFLPRGVVHVVRNGKLVALAREQFEVLITLDKGILFQHDHRRQALRMVRSVT